MFYKIMNIAISKVSPVYQKTNLSSLNSNIKKQSSNNDVMLSFLASLTVQKRAEIALQRMVEERFFESFLLTSGKVTKEEYEEIKKNHPSALIKAKEYCDSCYGGELTPYNAAVNTLRVHEYFKNNYKNYRIISLGTSPSPITEQLINMGHDVVFLPISGLRIGYKQNKTRLGNMAEMRTLMQYLDNKDIDDGKLNIVLDFASSGKTLNITTKFIKEYFGFNHKTLSKVSLGDRILDFYYDEHRNNFIKDAINSKIEEISNIPHYPVTPMGIELYDSEGDKDTTIIFDKDISRQEFFDEFESYSTPLARAFALCTMAEIEKLLSDNQGLS